MYYPVVVSDIRAGGYHLRIAIMIDRRAEFDWQQR
jgi:hypothetical protein